MQRLLGALCENRFLRNQYRFVTLKHIVCNDVKLLVDIQKRFCDALIDFLVTGQINSKLGNRFRIVTVRFNDPGIIIGLANKPLGFQIHLSAGMHLVAY